ncbi:MAG: dehydrogenase E1 component subunit alpha/beta [Victivallaceae bacterium]|nr:dehydrogenase E1 component subunit alpha/beta [Victivallaceae bacterium]MDD3117066.1 dehydrogenase E1 component subunit alpha/beta [Victivallaceae bacterium]MDD4317317.1 dehydrogenase E1 component subunit alpha/beta [Victivallaceae bacterium]MDD5662896.1 dehydrogenase E1 component subunit alpha/beta [Victivallaceae bacterium]
MKPYLADGVPSFKKQTIKLKSIPAYQYDNSLKDAYKAKKISKAEALEIYESMMVIREFEEMILKCRTGAYEVISDYDYRGPTHLSIGQEATAAGACSMLAIDDLITSTHRGHGDSIAKGFHAIRRMSEEQLKERCPEFSSLSGDALLEAVMEDHVFRTIAELFGKEEGYGKGRGGGMHIADFRVGHLGANAIVGGGVPIATGAAMACRIDPAMQKQVVLTFAGDGAYANGVVLESLNWAAQEQFNGPLAQTKKGLPLIFAIINNHYGMTGRADGEVNGVDFLARRAAGFDNDNMHAEVVNGMDIMAVRDAIARARAVIAKGEGPVLLEFDTYRYYGHSLSDPRNEYRTKEEEARWKEVDPVENFRKEMIAAGVAKAAELNAIDKKVAERNARAARRAADSPDPVPEDVIKYMYTDTTAEVVPEPYREPKTFDSITVKRDGNGQINYRDAIKEGIIEEMKRDGRVVLFGEDVAEYGGAFKLSKGMLEVFGRDRVFNTPISEACICGTGVGMAMNGYRPVVELMYMDFALMASDQISNQAAKWHYMTGASTEVPMVVRCSVGGGKGYGGQHSQSLESMFAHIPGTYVAYPSNPYDAKGLIKTAIRNNNPVVFVEGQLLYNVKGVVPEEEYLIPFGEANIIREGKDATIVVWGPAVSDALKAAEQLAAEGIEVEVIDPRTLVPFDWDTVFASVRKTGRCVAISQCVDIGSFTGEIVSQITAECFDDLDAPVLKVGAKNGIAPQAFTLEQAFLPNVQDMVNAVKKLF